jgi:hypothetical protein
MSAAAPPKIVCREIADSDIESIVDFFARGYPYRPRAYWIRGLDRLARRTTPVGYPKFGYLMERSGVLAGAILTIFSVVKANGGTTVRCTFGGWYVEPGSRGYAQFLAYRSLQHPEATYLNIPGPEIVRVVERLGFTRYSAGQFATIPLLSLRSTGARTRILSANTRLDVPVDPIERDVLLDHDGYGCTSFWCAADDRAYPFVFHFRKLHGFIPCARLIYCRSIDDFVRFARPIGWHLLRRGRPLVLLDANGPVPGLVGKYFDGSRPKYFKGPTQPRLGDLAYTQLAMFEFED